MSLRGRRSARAVRLVLAAISQVGMLVVVFLLWRTPLFVVGDTAITDHVFLWGSDGLSIWEDDAASRWISSIQLVLFVVIVVQALFAMFASRWRFYRPSFGVVTIAGTVVSYLHARRIAPSSDAVSSVSDGVQLLLLLVALGFLLQGAVTRSAKRGTRGANALDHV